MKDPTAREDFWVDKFNCFASLGLNSMDISMQIDSCVEYSVYLYSTPDLITEEGAAPRNILYFQNKSSI